jgi:hypothetical protein
MPTHAFCLATPAACLPHQFQAFPPRLTAHRELQHTGPGLTLQNDTAEGYAVTNLTLCGRPLGKRQTS